MRLLISGVDYNKIMCTVKIYIYVHAVGFYGAGCNLVPKIWMKKIAGLEFSDLTKMLVAGIFRSYKISLLALQKFTPKITQSCT